MECVEFRTRARVLDIKKKHSDVDARNWNSGTSTPEHYVRAPSKERTQKTATNPILNKFGEKISLILFFIERARASLNARIYGSAWWSAKRWINSSTIDHRLTRATPGKNWKKKYRARDEFWNWNIGQNIPSHTEEDAWQTQLDCASTASTVGTVACCHTAYREIEFWQILAKNTFQYFISAHGRQKKIV